MLKTSEKSECFETQTQVRKLPALQVGMAEWLHKRAKMQFTIPPTMLITQQLLLKPTGQAKII